MEEIIATTKRSMYIICYIIFLILGVFFCVIGLLVAFAGGNLGESEETAVGWLLFAFGMIFIIMSICYLVYFAKMPKNAVTFKDGKLNFMNKVECLPTEVDSWQASDHGLDGALFNFGKLNVVINGKQYKFKFVDNAKNVPARLYTLKMEYAMKAEIAKKADKEPTEKAEEAVTETAEPAATETTEEKTEE